MLLNAASLQRKTQIRTEIRCWHGRGRQSQSWMWTGRLPSGGRGRACNGWGCFLAQSSSCSDSDCVPAGSLPPGFYLHSQNAAGNSLQGHNTGKLSTAHTLLNYTCKKSMKCSAQFRTMRLNYKMLHHFSMRNQERIQVIFHPNCGLLVATTVTTMIKRFVIYCTTSQLPVIEPSLSPRSVNAAISNDYLHERN